MYPLAPRRWSQAPGAASGLWRGRSPRDTFPTVRENELKAFLIRSFTPEQLELLLHSLPGLRHLRPKLVSSDFLSPAKYTFEVVAELERDGSLNEAFFAALRRERPNRAGEIDLLEPLFITTPAAAASSTSDATDHVPGDVKPGDTCTAWVPPISTTTATGRLIGASEPELYPTLRMWCREHWGTLAVAFLIPFVGVAAAYLLSTLVPVLAEHFTTDRTSFFVTAAQVGQMCFSIYAWILFGGWHSPHHSTTFTLSPSYRQLLASKVAAEDGDIELRRALGAANDDGKLEGWFKAAETGGQQMSGLLGNLWLCWALLYAGLIATDIASVSYPPFETTAGFYAKAITTMLNNCTAAVIVVIFWVMTFVTVPIAILGSHGLVPRRSTRLRRIVGLVVGAIFVAHVVSLIFANPYSWHSLDCAFGLVSGVASSVIMAMLFGRFDSKFLGVPLYVLAALFVWAAIQPSWPTLELIETMRSGPGRLPWYPVVQVVLYSYAWLAKFLFFVLCAWLFHTGRFEFFLLRLRRLQTSVSEDWHKVTR